MSDFEVQKNQVADWNAKNKWKKRGITIIPTKYGISFTGLSKNQGGALVHVRQTITKYIIFYSSTLKPFFPITRSTWMALF